MYHHIDTFSHHGEQDLLCTHSLTLTSSPSVWRQCCLNAGKICSLRALRSTKLSEHKHLLKVWTLFILSLVIIIPSSLTLGVGAQVDFHAGLHLIFSRGHGKGRRLLLEEGKNLGACGKEIGNRHIQQVNHSTQWTSPLGCCFSSLPLHSGNSALTCLHSWFACTRPLQKVQNAHLKSKNKTQKISMRV